MLFKLAIGLLFSVSAFGTNLPQNTQSPATSTERIARAKIDANCASVTHQSGSWISSVSGSASDCTLNLVVGTFSVAPDCVCSPEQNTTTGGLVCIIQDSSTSVINYIVKAASGSGGSTDPANIICMGPR